MQTMEDWRVKLQRAAETLAVIYVIIWIKDLLQLLITGAEESAAITKGPAPQM